MSFDLEKELRELAESKEFLKALSDIDYSKHIVDALCEDTGFAKWKVKLAFKTLAPIVSCLAEGAGKLLADGMKQKMLSLAARVPWTEQLVKTIKDRTTKTAQEIQASKDAKAYLKQRRSADQEALTFRKDMSLEFNLALDTYTATQEMRVEFGDSLDGIRDALGRIEGFVNPQPQFKQPIESNTRSRFVYRSGYIPFFGRTEELQKLHDFLWSEHLFRWQAITAPGGAGKSRLAWEFCQRSSVIWRAGFLHDLVSAKATFGSWQPMQPTLVVLDYASKDRETVKGILETLSERADLDCAVRVLLLDRNSSENWLSEGWHGSNGHAVKCCQHQEPWLLDASLGEEPSKEMIRFFLGEDKPHSEMEMQQHLMALNQIDPEQRPLFAAFYADAVAREGSGRRWDRESLVHDVIEREKDNYWHRDGKRIVTAKDEALLALATMIGGVSSTHRGLPPNVTPVEELLEHPNRFSALGGYAENNDLGEAVQVIPAWEPDLVGEFYVLNFLKDNSQIKTNQLRKPLLCAAWNYSALGTATLLDKMAQDYPTDPTLLKLCRPPRHDTLQIILWSAACVNIIRSFAKSTKPDNALLIYNLVKGLASHDKQLEKYQAECATNLALAKNTDTIDFEKINIDFTNILARNKNNRKIILNRAKFCANLIGHANPKQDLKRIAYYLEEIVEIYKLFSTDEEIRDTLLAALVNTTRSCCIFNELDKAKEAYKFILNLHKALPNAQNIQHAVAVAAGFLAGFNYMFKKYEEALEFETTFNSIYKYEDKDPKLDELAHFIYFLKPIINPA